MQTTGLQAVDSGRNNTTFDESDEPKGKRESKSEEEDSKEEEFNNPQETQNLQNTHASMKSRKRELRPESSNSPYRIESWLTQLSQNNKQNPWLVTLQDPLDGQGLEQTASCSRQPIRAHSMEKI